MNVNLNKKSWLIKYYKWAYNIRTDENLKNNFCLFFWELIFALLMFPLLVFSIPLDMRYGESIGIRILKSIFVICSIIIIIAIILTIVKLILYGLSIFGIFSFIFYFFGIIISSYLIYHIGIIVFSCLDSPTITNIMNITKAKKDSFIKKYCPKINWHD